MRRLMILATALIIGRLMPVLGRAYGSRTSSQVVRRG